MCALAADLVSEANDAAESSEGAAKLDGMFKVPADIRKSKVKDVMGLLEREYVPCALLSPFHVSTFMLTAALIGAPSSTRRRNGWSG